MSPDPADRDWTYEVTERIESVVDTIRSKTTVPAVLAAETVVYGLVAAILCAALIVLLVVAGVRLLDNYLPFDPRGRRVWVAYAIVAAIFLGVGAFLWRKRLPRGA